MSFLCPNLNVARHFRNGIFSWNGGSTIIGESVNDFFTHNKYHGVVIVLYFKDGGVTTLTIIMFCRGQL